MKRLRNLNLYQGLAGALTLLLLGYIIAIRNNVLGGLGLVVILLFLSPIILLLLVAGRNNHSNQGSFKLFRLRDIVVLLLLILFWLYLFHPSFIYIN